MMTDYPHRHLNVPEKDRHLNKNFEKYLKKVWFANGIHHHYSTDKFTPEFSEQFFAAQIAALSEDQLPLQSNQSKEAFTKLISEVIFDSNVYPKGCNQAEGEDLVLTSANNY